MNALDALIDLAINEDIGSGDITTEAIIPAGSLGVGKIEAKQDIMISGMKVAEKVFNKVDSSLEWSPRCEDGDFIEEGGLIAEVKGSVASLLKAERIALNFLQHLSGIATFTKLFVSKIENSGTKILDTRKTKPGYRELEKEAVKMGHGQNHRMGLFDRYLIKNNHITAAGSISEAVKRVKDKRPKGVLIEVEVKDIAELEEALGCGVDIIMLDNFVPSLVSEAVKITNKAVKLEVSGNVNLDTIQDYANRGVDFISTGAITHSAPAADIHMLISE